MMKEIRWMDAAGQQKNDTTFKAHLDFLILDPPEEKLLIYAHLVTNSCFYVACIIIY
jgi:hypothetical protein